MATTQQRKCSVYVRDKITRRSRPCATRDALREHDGVWYCGMHDPTTRDVQEELSRIYAAKRAAAEAEMRALYAYMIQDGGLETLRRLLQLQRQYPGIKPEEEMQHG